MQMSNQVESQVRSYCRNYPVEFTSASGAYLFDTTGKAYIDFLSGAGALNYGHNEPKMQQRLLEYIRHNGVTHGLDLVTSAKESFLKKFNDYILTPREMCYKIQFTGPTGANAVEAALKLARLITSRNSVICFSNAFHGMTQGALSVTANQYYRRNFALPPSASCFMPYDGYIENSMEYIERCLADKASGIDIPAAIIVETIQGEGGINVAQNTWLQRLQALCKEYKILLIVDDIQAGCGRSGTFFSFEDAGLDPDIIVLSKSISGYGLPMSLLLMKEEHDKWAPGQHNGTFRGNNLAFVTAGQMLQSYWRPGSSFPNALAKKCVDFRAILEGYLAQYKLSEHIKMKGRGMMIGLEMQEGALAQQIMTDAFKQ